eukprot:740778-Pyramimonas_sp.AAC.1
MMKLKAIITHPFPYTERGQEKVPTSSSFDLSLLSQETRVRSLLRPNFTVPGPAFQGPAKPSAPGNGLPIDMNLTGSNGDDPFVSYYPFSRDGPVRPPAAKPSGGAGQDKEGDGKSDAPSAEIMSTRDEDSAKRPDEPRPGSPGGSGPSDGG